MKYLILLTSIGLAASTGLVIASEDLSHHQVLVQVVSPDGNQVEDVVVYATPSTVNRAHNVNPEPLVIDQREKKFAPYITVMQKGQKLRFDNHDDITHHIYSVSGENRFEFKLKAGENKETQAMKSAEEVAMGCNIHDWMSGYALVVDTPYFTKSSNNGVAELMLPSGQYQLTVWHPQLDVT